MREAISNCEKSFISEIVSNDKRLDGRDLDEFRSIRINFGAEWGSVHVALGETRVLAQVTCEVAVPKLTRPNEGLLFIKVELGPMAGPQFEANRTSDLGVQVNRILERAFKDSRCVDLESLCIMAEEKVWNLRVDLNVLNHEGNIIDCASIAALAALAHFKRPDVTTSGDEFIIHTHAEKDPIPIVLHHYPICVSYAVFNSGKTLIADPTALEERVAEANLVFGLNSYRELCGLHFGGITLTSSHLLLKSATRGAKHAKRVVDMIKQCLKEDEVARTEQIPSGFTECVRLNKMTSIAQNQMTIKLPRFKLNPSDELSDDEEMESNEDVNESEEVKNINKTSAVMLPKDLKWVPESDFEDSEDDITDDDDEIESAPPLPKTKVKLEKTKKKEKKKSIKSEAMSTDSEEDETVQI